MDDKTQKERLEQELRFLKESFEAEVISKEEFEKGSDRIERKLKEIDSAKIEETKIEQSEEKQEKPEEAIEEQKKYESIKTEEIKPKIQETKEQEPIEKIVEKHASEEPKTEIKEEKKDNFLKYAVVFIILVLIIYFSYSFLKSNEETQENKQLKFIAACNSDEDCKQEGKEGFCLNPRAKDAKCEFKEVPKTNVIVLNDRKNCFNCDTARVINILSEWFGPLNIKEIDYNTNDGKNLAERFNARLLPMYILNENITKKPAFEQFGQALTKKNDTYILSEDAAGSTFYFKRDNIPNKLDLFVISGDDASIRIEKNLKEFLEEFKDVKFDKYLSNDKFAQELKIKTFPTFLINNRIKFSGVHTAETIKENFCEMNKLKECEKNLSKSLV